ncbi:MAG: hypothetical protein ACKPKO_25610, partial [Candidatus Fonsibacter sp.]
NLKFKKRTEFPLVLASFFGGLLTFSITGYHMMNLSVNSLGLFTNNHQIITITFPIKKNPQNQDHTHHGKNPKCHEKKWYN